MDTWQEIWPVIGPLIEKVRAGEEALMFENQLIPIYRNGKLEEVYWTFSYSAVRDDNNKIEGVLVVCQETTQQVIKYHKVVEQVKTPIVIYKGEELIIEEANKAALDMWRVGKEVIGKPFLQMIPEMRDQGFAELLLHVYHTGEAYIGVESPARFSRREGGKEETFYFNFEFTPYREANGTISGVMVLATDVTEQVITRKKVEESNKELQFAMNAMPQMVWVTKPDGYHEFYNQQWFDYTGLSFEDTKGAGWNHVFHPDDQQRAWKRWQHSLETGEPYEIEYRCRRFDGEYRWVLGRALPLRDASGTILKWYGTCTDIHDQKKAAELMEEKIQERTKDLQKANAELEQFTFVSHHDLKEPLRKMIVFADMVKSDSYERLTEASQKRLDTVIKSANRMNAALKDVLNFASLSSVEPFTPVDLDEVVASIHSDLEQVISETKAKITSDALPTISAVPVQMHQLFYHLIDNSLKYARWNNPPVISITCKKVTRAEAMKLPDLDGSKEYYAIAIKDNGIGFKQEAADKIFGIFQRLHSKDAYPGTGIGLAICKKVVSNHKGIIHAESREDEGATFTVCLPVE